MATSKRESNFEWESFFNDSTDPVLVKFPTNVSWHIFGKNSNRFLEPFQQHCHRNYHWRSCPIIIFRHTRNEKISFTSAFIFKSFVQWSYHNWNEKQDWKLSVYMPSPRYFSINWRTITDNVYCNAQIYSNISTSSQKYSKVLKLFKGTQVHKSTQKYS